MKIFQIIFLINISDFSCKLLNFLLEAWGGKGEQVLLFVCLFVLIVPSEKTNFKESVEVSNCDHVSFKLPVLSV